MLKVTPLGGRKLEMINSKMISFLKVMYYFGYLPFTWTTIDDPQYDEVKFEISNCKTILMLTYDFIIGLLVLFYFYLWHWLNLGKDFDMTLLLHH